MKREYLITWKRERRNGDGAERPWRTVRNRRLYQTEGPARDFGLGLLSEEPGNGPCWCPGQLSGYPDKSCDLCQEIARPAFDVLLRSRPVGPWEDEEG